MGDTTIAASVVHVNDCAMTAAQMIAEAGRRGMVWDFVPLASKGRRWDTPVAKLEKAARGALWLTRLAAEAARHDFVHVHSASVMGHAKYAVRRFVLHCHGSDVRTLQYDPAWKSTVVGALNRAEEVFYPTPELHEHVLQHRQDAVYVPIPLDPSLLPERNPAGGRGGRPTVFFASRWGQDKGGETQLRTAEQLLRAVPDGVDVVGLDWGPLVEQARATGIRLVPPMPRPDYLAALANADVVVGQAAGILATSELEVLGIGTPLVLPVPTPAYGDRPPPVYGDSVDTAVDAVRDLINGAVDHDPATGKDYIDAYHHIRHAVDAAVAAYSRARARRASIGQPAPTR